MKLRLDDDQPEPIGAVGRDFGANPKPGDVMEFRPKIEVVEVGDNRNWICYKICFGPVSSSQQVLYAHCSPGNWKRWVEQTQFVNVQLAEDGNAGS